MAHLTKVKTYDIKDSNIELLGSDLEKNVREHAGDKETAWEHAGSSPGLEIWRIEHFHVVPWPKDKAGSFYDGDSYIVLHTYKKTPDAESLSYDLHFWLGENTSQDEAGTAAYKTVELDDHLHGIPVQYREVQGYESPRFISYFPRIIFLRGGVSTGFHHVSLPPPEAMHKLYRVIFTRSSATHSSLIVREVSPEASSLIKGDVYVLDKGTKVWQLNTEASAGQEKFKAAEFVQHLMQDRKACHLTVYDEGVTGYGLFLAEFGEGTTLQPRFPLREEISPTLFRLSDASGQITFESVQAVSLSVLSTSDAFLLDNSSHSVHPAVYVWIGNGASLNERRLAPQYGQRYLHQKGGDRLLVATPIIKMVEGYETEEFLHALRQ